MPDLRLAGQAKAIATDQRIEIATLKEIAPLIEIAPLAPSQTQRINIGGEGEMRFKIRYGDGREILNNGLYFFPGYALVVRVLPNSVQTYYESDPPD